MLQAPMRKQYQYREKNRPVYKRAEYLFYICPFIPFQFLLIHPVQSTLSVTKFNMLHSISLLILQNTLPSVTFRFDTKVITIRKEPGSEFGIEIIGGNKIGIYISKVEDESIAAHYGIMFGWRIRTVSCLSLFFIERGDLGQQAIISRLSMQEC